MKRKKIFLVLLMSLVMVLGSSVTALADDVERSSYYADFEKVILDDGTEIVYSDYAVGDYADRLTQFQGSAFKTWTDYLILRPDQNNVYILYFDKGSNVYADVYSSSGFHVKFATRSGSSVVGLRFYYSDAWTIQKFDLNYTSGFYCVNSWYDNSWDHVADKLKPSIVCATCPIYYEDSADEVFMNAPLPMIPGVLAPVINKVGMTGALSQVMNLIPLGLTCLVGFLALRKALQVLQGILHQA